MLKVKRLEDARERLYAAKKLVEECNYAGALSEAQRCIELSVKALLEELGIEYGEIKGKKKRVKVPHDVSEFIPDAIKRVEEHLEEFQVIDLARAAVLLKLLTSIRNYLEYGVEYRNQVLVSSKELFDRFFGEKLVSIVIPFVERSYWTIHNVLLQIKGF